MITTDQNQEVVDNEENHWLLEEVDTETRVVLVRKKRV